MKFFIGVLGVMILSVLAGPVGAVIAVIALFIQEQANESKLTKQRELSRIENEAAAKELRELREKEVLQNKKAEVVEKVKRVLSDHEKKKKMIKNAIKRNETTYMLKGKKHIFDGEEFICIEDD